MLRLAMACAVAALCAPAGELHFVCGAEHPEDLAHIPDTPWLIASGFADGAGLKLVDTRTDTLVRWYTGSSEQVDRDASSFPDCPGAPEPGLFNAHGINLKPRSGGGYTLYVVNHGGRESVEVFSVGVAGVAGVSGAAGGDAGAATDATDATDAAPAADTADAPAPRLVWKGCVLLPRGFAANSVAAYNDGTILATILTRPGTSITDFVQGQKTGEVLEWQPGSGGFKPIPGTELPGNNGLETSADDKGFFVVAFGWHAVVSYSRAHPGGPVGQAVAPGFMPDNIHWDDGRLLAAGMQWDEPACGGTRRIINGKADDMRCHRGYSVAQLDPATMTFRLLAYSEPNPAFNGVSAAVIIGNELWLGSYQADRIAHRTLTVLPP